MRARAFPFGDDFRRPVPDEADIASRAALEQDAHARGLAEGRALAEAETARRLAEATERIGPGLAAAFGELDRVGAAIEADAVGFFEAAARALAARALADAPLAGVADAALAAFRHLRGVPHLAVRVNEALVEGTDALLARLARENGYEGRVIVLGDAAIPLGDVRIEWADGGVLRDGAAVTAAVQACLGGGGPAWNAAGQAERSAA